MEEKRKDGREGKGKGKGKMSAGAGFCGGGLIYLG